MSSSDWTGMTASDLGRGIAAGRIDPRELADAYLDACDAHPERDRVYARLTPARARAEADAAAKRARDGVRRGLLDGVPLSWKDLFDTAGVATEAGSALLKGRTPDHDAETLARATRAGTVCLGKTHLSELAFSGLGVNPVTATSPNRHDPDWAPGGSSSGAAASVALGLAPAGIGSDTAGSVRVPSAWNDLVGLKTTAGLVPLAGSVPLMPTYDTVGPLCRSVEDAARINAILAGTPVPDLEGASLAGARLLIDEGVTLADVREAPGAAFEDAVRRLEAAGATVERTTLPELAEAHALGPTAMVPEAWAVWGETIEAHGEVMFRQIRERFGGGKGTLAHECLRARMRLAMLREHLLEKLAGYDALIAPTSPIQPPSVTRLLADDDYYQTENLLALRNTRLGNVLGLCALTLPTGTPACGVMLMGPPLSEARLCRLGAAAEAALR